MSLEHLLGRVQIEAANALGSSASPANNFAGLSHLIAFYRDTCCEPDASSEENASLVPKGYGPTDVPAYLVIQVGPAARLVVVQTTNWPDNSILHRASASSLGSASHVVIVTHVYIRFCLTMLSSSHCTLLASFGGFLAFT